MANSTTNIDTISQSQSGKEVTANAFFDAASPATVYGRRASACSGLTWGYYGGAPTLSGGSLGSISNGTLSLAPSATNYIVAAKATGAVTVSTSNTNWNNTTDYWRLYSIVVGASTITSYTDSRELGKMTGGGGTGAAITVKDDGSNLTTALASIDFVGGGVTATTSGNNVTVTIGGSASITAKDEGSNLTTSMASINFAGAGVTATNSGDDVTVTIPGGGSASITAKDEGSTLTTSMSSINFAGAGVTATNSGSNVTVTIPGGGGREVLSADRTYYVRTDGSDSNSGLSNTAGGAFLTIQKVYSTALQTLDTAGYNVIAQIADGTYTGAITVSCQLVGGGTFIIQGNASTPANVLLSTGANTTLTAQNSAVVNIKDCKITNTGGNGITSTLNATINFQNIDFGAVGVNQIVAADTGAVVCTGNYAISGGGACHMRAASGFVRVSSRTVTISGTPAYSTAFAQSVTAGIITAGSNTYSGTGATGVRYDVNLNSVINTNSGGANYFPGNSAGTTATGGQYA